MHVIQSLKRQIYLAADKKVYCNVVRLQDYDDNIWADMEKVNGSVCEEFNCVVAPDKCVQNWHKF